MGAYSKNKINNIVVSQNGCETKLIWLHHMSNLSTIHISVLLQSSFIERKCGIKTWFCFLMKLP